MLFDGLKKRERALLIRVFNGDPSAYMKLSRDYYATYLPIPGSPKGDASKVLRGMPSLNKRTGKYFYRLVDIDALKKIAPEIKRNTASGSQLVKALESLRELPLIELKAALSPKLWRCDRCQQYFEAKDLRYRRYCSPECGHNQEAEKAVKIGRLSDRARKLQQAREAQKICPPDTDWKRLVAVSAGVTKNFLTYAVRRGELGGPVHPGRRARSRSPLKSISDYHDLVGEMQGLVSTEPEGRTKKQEKLARDIANATEQAARRKHGKATTRSGHRFSGEVVQEVEIDGVGVELNCES